ncbi:hypothetical protein BHM03_00024487 [Ensete ventricosum]|nr:hypothetical protein BHM03_00024487 [Ensete ventricosum]
MLRRIEKTNDNDSMAINECVPLFLSSATTEVRKIHGWHRLLGSHAVNWQSPVLKVVTARGGCRSVSLAVALRWCWANLSKTEKEKRKQSNEGRSDLKKRAVTKICRLSAGSSGAGDRGCQGCWSVGGTGDLGGGRGGSHGGRFYWRMCRRRLLSLSVGFQEIYSNEKKNSSARCEKLSGGCGFTEKEQMNCCDSRWVGVDGRKWLPVVRR